MRAPNFFIVGAPKCGTTALCEYLRSHPQVCFARPKEPNFFNTDLPGLRFTRSEHAYLREVFGHCAPQHRAVGEGSVLYMISRDAVPNLVRFRPGARVIALVRNPIDMVYSLHSQHLYNFLEDEPDFARAWRLQSERRAGRRIPAKCPEPRVLQYAEMGKLGAQIERVRRVVPRAQLRVIVFDDLRADAASVYRRTLEFLDLDDDGRTDFPVVNDNKVHPWWFRRFVGGLPPGFGRAVMRVRGVFGVQELGFRKRIGAASARRVRRAPLPAALRAELAETFRPDVERLGQLLERDLRHWLEDPPEPARAAEAEGRAPCAPPA